MLKIESSIPLPNDRGLGAPKKYPIDKMKVGDSVFVPGQTATRAHSTFKSGARSRGLMNHKFVARTVEGGARVWRIE